VKMKTILSFHLGPAVYAFCGCVASSMIASLVFDPHSLWDDKG
jgi:paraquat-inducible protein A